MADTALRPLRRIERRAPNGQSAGWFETRLTDEELAEQNRQWEARREALQRSGMAQAQAEQRARLAADDRDLDALAAHGRDDLRAAHTRLEATRADLDRRRGAVVAAEQHLSECRAAFDAAERVGAAHDAARVAALKLQLEGGAVPPGPTAKAPDIAAARRGLDHAIRAHDELAGAVEAAEQDVTGAEAQVKAAARGVIRAYLRDRRRELAGLEARVEELQDTINDLMPCLEDRPWPVPWLPAAERLLHDPDAALTEPAPEAGAVA